MYLLQGFTFEELFKNVLFRLFKEEESRWFCYTGYSCRVVIFGKVKRTIVLKKPEGQHVVLIFRYYVLVFCFYHKIQFLDKISVKEKQTSWIFTSLATMYMYVN